jgi:hypothetical protein
MPPAPSTPAQLAGQRLVVNTDAPTVLRSDTLKKPGALTSSKCWVALTNETLTWFSSQPPAGADLAKVEVPDHKHRISLAELAIWESYDHDTDFEIEVEGLKPLRFRCKDVSAAAGWVEAIRAAKAEAEVRLQDVASGWLAHLNACQARGCTHQKYCCGFCRPHFRLFFGEDPEVEAARLRAEAEQPRFKAALHAIVLPRLVGTLSTERKKEGLGLELSDEDGVVVACRKVTWHGLTWLDLT